MRILHCTVCDEFNSSIYIVAHVSSVGCQISVANKHVYSSKCQRDRQGENAKEPSETKKQKQPNS